MPRHAMTRRSPSRAVPSAFCRTLNEFIKTDIRCIRFCHPLRLILRLVEYYAVNLIVCIVTVAEKLALSV
jgi:hypothetical protein